MERVFEERLESLGKQLQAQGIQFQQSIQGNSQVFSECDQNQFSQFMDTFWA